MSIAAFLEYLVHWDRLALEASQTLHWGPLSVVFVLASAWWVKGLVFVGVGAVGDARSRRWLPATAACAATAAGLGAGLAALLKDVVDRARPALADPTFSPLVATPDSPSFPSGHAATAFAAAAVVGVFYPRLRWPLYGLAALVALSRVYLGVHFWLDILAGAALGLAIGLSGAWATKRVLRLCSARTAART